MRTAARRAMVSAASVRACSAAALTPADVLRTLQAEAVGRGIRRTFSSRRAIGQRRDDVRGSFRTSARGVLRGSGGDRGRTERWTGCAGAWWVRVM